MVFIERPAKGLSRCLADAALDPEKLRMHITEIAPGTRAHPPHTHAALEAFYVLEGHGMVETGGEQLALGPNEVLVLDASVEHGLVNTGDTPMRYMVIIAKA